MDIGIAVEEADFAEATGPKGSPIYLPEECILALSLSNNSSTREFKVDVNVVKAEEPRVDRS